MKPSFLRLRNFKSIGDGVQTIEMAPITLLFGANSAGKSTVLQALIYLREVLSSRNYDADRTQIGGEWLDLGGFRNLVHNRSYNDNAIELEIGFSLNGDSLPDFLSEHERVEIESAGFESAEVPLGRAESAGIKLSLRWSDARGESGYPYVAAYSVSVNDEPIASIASSADGRQVYLDSLNLGHSVFVPSEEADDAAVDETFQQRFLNEVSRSATVGAADRLQTLLASDRPFEDKTISEMEDLVSGAAKGQPYLLEKLAEELAARTSRQAAALKRLVKRELEEASGQPPLGYIGLIGLADALPKAETGLEFDSSLWTDQDTEDESDQVLFRLLAESLISGLVVGPLCLLDEWLHDFAYIGPLRDLPERNLVPKLSPDRSRWAKGLAAWELLHALSDRKIEEINFWLGTDCLKTGYQVAVKRYRELPTESPLFSYLDREMELDQQLTLKELVEDLPIKTRVILREEKTDLEVMAQDIGVGISQLLPVVVLAVVHESGLLAIEQPELHIHPAIQVELADLFARYAIDHDKTMLLETHSEHLMLRLLRRIRELPEEGESTATRLDKEAVSVVYVQTDFEGTRFERLRIDDDGDFVDEWPEGFFDERDQELFF